MAVGKSLGKLHWYYIGHIEQ